MKKWFWNCHDGGYPAVEANNHGAAVEMLRNMVIAGEISGVETFTFVAPEEVYSTSE